MSFRAPDLRARTADPVSTFFLLDAGDHADTVGVVGDLNAAAEHARLSTLALCGVLDSGVDAEFMDLAAVAAELCNAPAAFINIVAEHTIQVKGVFGGVAETTARSESFCTYALNRGAQILEVEDLTKDERFRDLETVRTGQYRFYAGAPMVIETGHTLGTICVMDDHPRTLTSSQRHGLQALARLATALVQRNTLSNVLAEVSDRLAHEAETDHLTGLRNRRGLQALLDGLRPGSSVALVDLDLFKHLNDTQGHEAGDAALQRFARHLLAECRDRDVPGRWGGEEFLLLLRGTGLEDAVSAVERIRLLWGQGAPVTMSAGVAEIAPGETALEALARADQAMYEAKRTGRNRVVASETPHPLP